MRPCNQCRRPVENQQQFCAECEMANQESGVKAKPSVSIAPIDPTQQPPVAWDQSVDKMAFGFTASVMTAFGGTGWLLFGTTGLLIGIGIGVACGGLVAMSFRY